MSRCAHIHAQRKRGTRDAACFWSVLLRALATKSRHSPNQPLRHLSCIYAARRAIPRAIHPIRYKSGDFFCSFGPGFRRTNSCCPGRAETRRIFPWDCSVCVFGAPGHNLLTGAALSQSLEGLGGSENQSRFLHGQILETKAVRALVNPNELESEFRAQIQQTGRLPEHRLPSIFAAHVSTALQNSAHESTHFLALPICVHFFSGGHTSVSASHRCWLSFLSSFPVSQSSPRAGASGLKTPSFAGQAKMNERIFAAAGLSQQLWEQSLSAPPLAQINWRSYWEASRCDCFRQPPRTSVDFEKHEKTLDFPRKGHFLRKRGNAPPGNSHSE